MRRDTWRKDRFTVAVVLASGVTDPAEIARKLGWHKDRVEQAMIPHTTRAGVRRPGEDPLAFAVQRAKQGQ